MANKKDKHVESALASLKKEVTQTREDVKPGNDAEAKPKVKWTDVARTVDHRRTTHRH